MKARTDSVTPGYSGSMHRHTRGATQSSVPEERAGTPIRTEVIGPAGRLRRLTQLLHYLLPRYAKL